MIFYTRLLSIGIVLSVSLALNANATSKTKDKYYHPCCSLPCLNGGVCSSVGFHEYVCDCTSTGYYGFNCENAYLLTWVSNALAISPETKHHIVVNHQWIWDIINSWEYFHDIIIHLVYRDRSKYIPRPPLYTSYASYATITAAFNDSFYARVLPPLPENCPTPMGVVGKKQLPDVKVIVDRLLRRREFKPDALNSSLHLPAFAQHFTHEFFHTDYEKGPGYHIGIHGVDASQIYGDDYVRECKLRSYHGGRLKSQILNNEEYPPYLNETHIYMMYPSTATNDSMFGLGHPFFGLLPTLFLYSTIWLREHNRVATIMATIHPEWTDEQIYQTTKLIIIGETIQIVVTDYVQTISNYNLKVTFKPELLFNTPFQYHNRIHLEFSYLYHWHPMMPDEITIDDQKYQMADMLYHGELVIKHGVSKFAEAMTKQVSGAMTWRNHGNVTLKVISRVLEYERSLRFQSFNQYRLHFGLQPYSSFQDLTGEEEISAILEELYGDVDAVEFFVGLITEKHAEKAKFGIGILQIGAAFSITGLLSNPICSPKMWKPSTFGGEIGFNIIKQASLKTLFCNNIKGSCPTISFTVPEENRKCDNCVKTEL